MNDFPWLTVLIAAAARRRGRDVLPCRTGHATALPKQVALGVSLLTLVARRR